MEADFQRFYQIDLNRAVWREGMTMRRLMILIRGLPYESNYVQFIKDSDQYSLASYDKQNLTIR